MEWTTWLVLVLAYLFGSVPAGAWVARFYGVDIRKVGSGNTGATNILRTLGAGPAALVALFDVFKGGIAVIVAKLFGIEGLLLGGVAIAAVLGHNYSVFLRFRGGKGVATSFGALAFLDPLVALTALPVGITTIWLTRFVSAGSMVGGLTAVLTSIAMGKPLWEILTLIVVAGLIFWSHRENIKRLQAGNERRFGEKTKPVAAEEAKPAS